MFHAAVVSHRVKLKTAWRLVVFAALALIAWDGVLHIIGLLFTDADYNLSVDLPWILWPDFPTWRLYDLFWATLHISAFAILSLDRFYVRGKSA
ncbi:hypothetical protein [Mesorhizobium sp. B2-1-2]|uniref:hypothetical protein n=1 Tax=Mesorhizobium sp. B2-1-2 TaxID=2589973 RepID=UPI001128F9F9|nr:hypothetical protein [Mesorhizobium sp. B2-1-2]TPN11731.1 hypothetical protein FJ971_10015 [Mesorhizobium sp. B2-1-2]